MVCEGKFFMFFSDSDADDLNEQLDSQRRQVRHLFLRIGRRCVLTATWPFYRSVRRPATSRQML